MSSSDVSLGGSNPVNIPRKSQDPSFGRAALPIETIPDQFEKGQAENAAQKAEKHKTLMQVLGVSGAVAAVGAVVTVVVTRGKGAKTAEKAVEKAAEDVKGSATNSPKQEVVKAPEPNHTDSDSSASSYAETVFSHDGKTSNHASPEMDDVIPPKKGSNSTTQSGEEIINDAASIRSTGSTRVTEATADLKAAENKAKDASENLQKQQAEAARLQKQQVEADAKAARLLQDHENANADVVRLNQELKKAKADDATEDVTRLQQDLAKATAKADQLKQEAGLVVAPIKGDSVVAPKGSEIEAAGVGTQHLSQEALDEMVKAALVKELEAQAGKGGAKTEIGFVEGASTNAAAQAPKKQTWGEWWSGSKPSQNTNDIPAVKTEIPKPQGANNTNASATTTPTTQVAPKPPETVSGNTVPEPDDFNAQAGILASQKEAGTLASMKGEISIDPEKGHLNTANGQAKSNQLLGTLDDAGKLKTQLMNHPDQRFCLDGNDSHGVTWISKKERLVYDHAPSGQHFEVGVGKKGLEDGALTKLSDERVHKLNMKSSEFDSVGRFSPTEAKTYLQNSEITHIHSAEKAPPKIEKFSNLFHANRKSDITVRFWNKNTFKMQELTIENSKFSKLQDLGILPKDLKGSDIKDYAVEGRGGKIWTNSKANPDFKDRSGLTWFDTLFRSDAAKLAKYDDAKITKEMTARGATKPEIDAALRNAAIIRKSIAKPETSVTTPAGGTTTPSTASSEYKDDWANWNAEETKLKEEAAETVKSKATASTAAAEAAAKARSKAADKEKAKAEETVKARATAAAAAIEASAKARSKAAAKADEAKLRAEEVELRKKWSKTEQRWGSGEHLQPGEVPQARKTSALDEDGDYHSSLAGINKSLNKPEEKLEEEFDKSDTESLRSTITIPREELIASPAEESGARKKWFSSKVDKVRTGVKRTFTIKKSKDDADSGYHSILNNSGTESKGSSSRSSIFSTKSDESETPSWVDGNAFNDTLQDVMGRLNNRTKPKEEKLIDIE